MDRRKKAKTENYELVRGCADPMCPLFDFRLGKNLLRSGLMSEEQKKAAAERLILMREANLNGDV